MNDKTIKSLIQVAKIHESHLRDALNQLEGMFPITAEKVAHLTKQEFLFLDFFINRFCKLQDFMGSKLIDAVLIELDIFSDNLTMLDKINKLEKFDLIKEARLWQEIRKLRNHLIHEYPDHPELTTQYLNQAYPLAFDLLEILNNLLKKLESTSQKISEPL